MKNKVWDIWTDDTITSFIPRKMPKSIPAPKKEYPSHAESYNPSKEYLLDEDEKKEQ